jgi:hypothetical protein
MLDRPVTFDFDMVGWRIVKLDSAVMTGHVLWESPLD